jgi:hypothetical protein
VKYTKTGSFSKKQSSVQEKLSSAEIDTILRNTASSKYEEVLRPKLEQLSYSKKYRSCFGDELITLYDQAVDRVECWRKNGASGPI